MSSDEVATATARIKEEKDGLVRSGRKCGRCWQPLVTPPLCFCGAASRLQQTGGLLRFGHVEVRLLLYMHRNDYLNSGNSGKLLKLLFPAATSIFVADHAPDEEKLAAAIGQSVGRPGGIGSSSSSSSSSSSRVCILFPGSGAVSLKDWSRDWQRDRPGQGGATTTTTTTTTTTSGATSGAKVERLSVVLIDGTWRQARRLVKRLLSRHNKARRSGNGDNDDSEEAATARGQQCGGRQPFLQQVVLDLSAAAKASRDESEPPPPPLWAPSQEPQQKQPPQEQQQPFFTSIFRRGARSRKSQRTRPRSKRRTNGSYGDDDDDDDDNDDNDGSDEGEDSGRTPVDAREVLVEGRICTAEAAGLLLDEAASIFGSWEATSMATSQQHLNDPGSKNAWQHSHSEYLEQHAGQQQQQQQQQWRRRQQKQLQKQQQRRGHYAGLVTEAVRLNNAALRGGPHTKRAGKSHWSGDGGHPAWYFGSRVVGGKEAPEISPPCK